MLQNIQPSKEKLELEKLQAELAKLKAEQHWFEKEKSLQINKMEQEVNKISKENKTFRIWGPIFLQMMPGILLVALSFWIAKRNNLLEQKTTVASIKEERLKYEQAKQDIVTQREIYEAETTRDRLNRFNEKLINDSMGLVKSNQMLSEQMQSQLFQNLQLKKANQFIIYGEWLKQLKQYPDPNSTLVFQMIERMKKNDAISDQIRDSLTKDLEVNKFSPVSAFMLLKAFRKTHYFESFVNQISVMVKQNRQGFYDSSTSTKNQYYYSLIDLIGNSYWTKDEAKQIIRTIVNSLKKEFVVNAPNIDLVNLPPILLNKLALSGNELDIDLVCDYILLNKSVLETDFSPQTVINGPNYSLGFLDTGTPYDFYLRNKLFLIDNIAFFCPQFYVSFFIKYGSRSLKAGIYNVANPDLKKPEEYFLFQKIIIRINHPTVLTDSLIHLCIPYEGNDKEIAEPLTDAEFLKKLDQTEMHLTTAYKTYEHAINLWLGKENYYFMQNRSAFRKKLASLTL